MRPRPSAEVAATPAPARPVPTTQRGLPVTLTCGALFGVLGLLVAPALLGPAAVVGGFAGEYLGRSGVRKAAAAVVLVAVACGLIGVLALR